MKKLQPTAYKIWFYLKETSPQVVSTEFFRAAFLKNIFRKLLLYISNIFCFCIHGRHSLYFFKVNNRKTRKRCERSSMLTIKTLEQHQWHHSGAFMVKISSSYSSLSIVDVEQVSVSQDNCFCTHDMIWKRMAFHRFGKCIKHRQITIYFNHIKLVWTLKIDRC